MEGLRDDTISAARMPVKYAFRDSAGIRDLIEDTKQTFRGKHYEYRTFDSGDRVIAHEDSGSRVARMMTACAMNVVARANTAP